jgi:guanylate kinase
MLATGQIYIITAPSGAGKTTLVRALLNADPKVKLSVSSTTRSPRSGELEGVQYHYVDHASFETSIKQGEFIEYACVYGHYYGTSSEKVKKLQEQGYDVLLEIDWQGFVQIRKKFPRAVGVFILPPSFDILEARLRGRATETEDVLQRRLAAVREEISHIGDFDYIIVNDRIDRASQDLISLVRGERLKAHKQLEQQKQLIASMLPINSDTPKNN